MGEEGREGGREGEEWRGEREREREGGGGVMGSKGERERGGESRE